MFSFLSDLLLFVVAISGLALPIWHRLVTYNGVERFSLALAGALLVAYLCIFSLYLTECPLRWFLVLSTAGWIFALARRGEFTLLWNNAAVRRTSGCWLVLSLWCLSWHGLIVSYSGAAWSGDWVEHYDRVHFYLQHWPKTHLFIGTYPLTSRPPLLNLLIAGLMSQMGGAFWHYQTLTTLFSTLVWFPLVVLLHRENKNFQIETALLLVLMGSPLFIQNATFPWTKLGCAFFVLMAIGQLSPSAGEPTTRRLVAGALLLSGGLLTHYSAGPWICSLGAAGLWTLRTRFREKEFQKAILVAFSAAAIFSLTWFAWAILEFGPQAFPADTAMGISPGGSFTERATHAFGNLWYTVLPIVRADDIPPQVSLLGQWRDYFFTFYQLKLPFAFGSLGAAILVWRSAKLKWSQENIFWAIVVVTVIILGTCSVAQPDLHGLTHISLQSLVLLGLLYLVTLVEYLPDWLRTLLRAGLIIDFIAGVVLHFGVQSFKLEQYFHSASPIAEIIKNYPVAARTNWAAKSALHFKFLADILNPTLLVCILGLLGLLALLLHRSAARQASIKIQS